MAAASRNRRRGAASSVRVHHRVHAWRKSPGRTGGTPRSPRGARRDPRRGIGRPGRAPRVPRRFGPVRRAPFAAESGMNGARLQMERPRGGCRADGGVRGVGGTLVVRTARWHRPGRRWRRRARASRCRCRSRTATCPAWSPAPVPPPPAAVSRLRGFSSSGARWHGCDRRARRHLVRIDRRTAARTWRLAPARRHRGRLGGCGDLCRQPALVRPPVPAGSLAAGASVAAGGSVVTSSPPPVPSGSLVTGPSVASVAVVVVGSDVEVTGVQPLSWIACPSPVQFLPGYCCDAPLLSR